MIVELVWLVVVFEFQFAECFSQYLFVVFSLLLD